MTRYRRALLALAVLGVAGQGLGSAHATTFAGTYRGVQVDFSLRGSDAAHYDVSLIATQNVVSVPSEQNLYLTITRCRTANKCTRIQHSKQPLKDGEIAISPDMSTASLHTTVRGVRLDIEATTTYVDPASNSVTNPGVTLYGLETGAGGPNPRFDVNVMSESTVRFGSVSCSGVRADTYSYQGLDQVGDDVRDPHSPVQPLPAAIVGGSAKRCS